MQHYSSKGDISRITMTQLALLSQITSLKNGTGNELDKN